MKLEEQDNKTRKKIRLRIIEEAIKQADRTLEQYSTIYDVPYQVEQNFGDYKSEETVKLFNSLVNRFTEESYQLLQDTFEIIRSNENSTGQNDINDSDLPF